MTGLGIAALPFGGYFDPDDGHARVTASRAIYVLLGRSELEFAEITQLGRYLTIWTSTRAWARKAIVP